MIITHACSAPTRAAALKNKAVHPSICCPGVMRVLDSDRYMLQNHRMAKENQNHCCPFCEPPSHACLSNKRINTTNAGLRRVSH